MSDVQAGDGWSNDEAELTPVYGIFSDDESDSESDDESDDESENETGVMLDYEQLQIVNLDSDRVPDESETYLGLPCTIRDTCFPVHERRLDTFDHFIADIFGVSCANEDGNVRVFGYWLYEDVSLRAVCWLVHLWCHLDVDLTIYSEYNVTLLGCERFDSGGYSTNYVIHPGPAARLAECKIYRRPKWWVGCAGGDVINVSTDKTYWSDTCDSDTETYGAVISGWSPFGPLFVGKN